LLGTKVLDKTLKPLGEVKTLEMVSTALWYPQEDFEYLIRHLPKLKYGNVEDAVNGIPRL
jgi:hypothetical protein